jgi:Caspase domain
MRRVVCAAVAFAAGLIGAAVAAPDRAALVVGNGAYSFATKLVNPANDAADVAKALREIGFDVVEGIDLCTGTGSFGALVIGVPQSVELHSDYGGRRLRGSQSNHNDG